MRFIAYLLLALTALVTLPGLGERDFWPPDEARYGRIAAEMDADGTLAALRLNDEVYGDKPPGFFWLVRAAAFLRGGVDEWAARLPSVLGAMIFVLACGLAVGRATGAHAGFLAGLLPLATWSFAWQARNAQLDMLFAGLATWAALDGFRALEESRPRLLLRAGLVLGLAIVVKGPLALLVLLLLGVWRLIGRPPRPEGLDFRGATLGMILLMLLPSALWLGLATWEAGFAFVRDELFMRNVVERAQSGLAHLQPWHFYLRRLPPALAPWLLFLPLFLWRGTRELIGAPGRRLAAFALLWVLLFLVLQSAFPGKRSIYAFLFHAPLFMTIAQAAAAGVSEKGGASTRRWSGFVLGLVSAILLVIAATFVALAWSPASFDWALDRIGDLGLHEPRAHLTSLRLPLPGEEDFVGLRHALRLCALPFAIGALLTTAALLRRRLDLALDKAALTFAFGFMAVAAALLPQLDAARSRRGLAAELRAILGPAELAIYRNLDEGLLYYFGRPIPELEGDRSRVSQDLPRRERRAALRVEADRALEQWLVAPGHDHLLIKAADRESLAPTVTGRRWEIVHHARVGSDTDFELLRFAPAAAEEERR